MHRKIFNQREKLQADVVLQQTHNCVQAAQRGPKRRLIHWNMNSKYSFTAQNGKRNTKQYWEHNWEHWETHTTMRETLTWETDNEEQTRKHETFTIKLQTEEHKTDTWVWQRGGGKAEEREQGNMREREDMPGWGNMDKHGGLKPKEVTRTYTST